MYTTGELIVNLVIVLIVIALLLARVSMEK